MSRLAAFASNTGWAVSISPFLIPRASIVAKILLFATVTAWAAALAALRSADQHIGDQGDAVRSLPDASSSEYHPLCLIGDLSAGRGREAHQQGLVPLELVGHGDIRALEAGDRR